MTFGRPVVCAVSSSGSPKIDNRQRQRTNVSARTDRIDDRGRNVTAEVSFVLSASIQDSLSAVRDSRECRDTRRPLTRNR